MHPLPSSRAFTDEILGKSPIPTATSPSDDTINLCAPFCFATEDKDGVILEKEAPALETYRFPQAELYQRIKFQIGQIPTIDPTERGRLAAQALHTILTTWSTDYLLQNP